MPSPSHRERIVASFGFLLLPEKNIVRIFCLADPRWIKPSKRPCWLNQQGYEEVDYLDLKFDWWYQRIYYRNCEMIDRSEYIIFYAPENNNSGAYKALKYAKLKKKNIINPFENENN